MNAFFKFWKLTDDVTSGAGPVVLETIIPIVLCHLHLFNCLCSSQQQQKSNAVPRTNIPKGTLLSNCTPHTLPTGAPSAHTKFGRASRQTTCVCVCVCGGGGGAIAQLVWCVATGVKTSGSLGVISLGKKLTHIYLSQLRSTDPEIRISN